MKNKILGIILIASLAANAFLVWNYFQNQNVTNTKINSQQNSLNQKEKISEFSKLFITKIVATGGQITFEDRNQIQKSLDELNNPIIKEKWENFILSDSSEKAGQTVVDMLVTLSDQMGK